MNWYVKYYGLDLRGISARLLYFLYPYSPVTTGPFSYRKLKQECYSDPLKEAIPF